MVRVMLKWRYPFHPPVDPLQGGEERDVEEQDRATRRTQRERRDESQRPVAKPRVKVMFSQNILDEVSYTCTFKNTPCFLNRLNLLKPKLCRKRQKAGYDFTLIYI